jgi:hypothetical protein
MRDYYGLAARKARSNSQTNPSERHEGALAVFDHPAGDSLASFAGSADTKIKAAAGVRARFQRGRSTTISHAQNFRQAHSLVVFALQSVPN